MSGSDSSSIGEGDVEADAEEGVEGESEGMAGARQ